MLKFKNFSIKNKIILPVVVFAITIVLISLVQSYLHNVKTIKTITSNHLKTTTSSRAHSINIFLDGCQKNIVDIGAGIGESGYFSLEKNSQEYISSTPRIRQRLESSRQEGFQDEIFLLNSTGMVVISTDKTQEGVDKSQDNYFIHGKKKTYIKDAYFSTTSNQKSIAISTPLKDKSGQFVGVAVMRINLSQLSEITTNRVGLGETGDIYLINQDGYMITPSRFKTDTFLTQKVETINANHCLKDLSFREQNLHQGHQAVQIFSDYRGVSVLGSHQTIDDIDWCLLAEIEKSEAFTPIRDLLKSSISKLLIISLSSLLIAFFIGKQISDPVLELHRGVKIIEEGNLDHEVAMNTKDEIGQLSKSFDKMVQAVKKSRAEVDQKVTQQTKKIEKSAQKLADQRKAILNVLEDVAEEKKAAEQQSRELEKFQLAVNQVSDHIVITDAEGIVLYFNPAAEKITGFSHDEVNGEKVGSEENWGGLMDQDFYQKMWATIKEEKKTFSGELTNKRKDGQEYLAFASLSPILDDKDEVVFFVGIERDITREKEIDRMKTEFISLASHQLRTPLSAMKWFLEMLLEGDAGELNQEQQEMIENVDQSNQRMIALVNGLLNISRIESGRVVVEPEPTDLKKLVNELLTELKPKIEAKDLQVIVSQNEKMGKINVDPNLTLEVFRNLITNAIKYTPKDGEITIMISKDDENVVLQVTDTGIGIPKVDQDKMFEKFHRGANVLKTEPDGTGLGLYLSKAIIESSQGKIWFESEEGKGTTFWFSLPLSGMTAKKGEVRLGEGHVKADDKKKKDKVKKEPQNDTKKKMKQKK